MKAYEHLESCPNSVVDRDPQDCVCETHWVKQDKIKGLEKLEEALDRMDLPTLFLWSSMINGFKDFDEDEFDECISEQD